MDLQELIEITNNLKRRRRMDKPTHVGKGKNSCGDEINLYLKVEDGRIKDASFDGDGCMLSMIAAESLCNHIVGKTVEEVRDLTYEDLTGTMPLTPSLGRLRCVLISLEVLKNALSDHREKD